MFFFNVAASASVYNDDFDDYAHASVSGITLTYCLTSSTILLVSFSSTCVSLMVAAMDERLSSYALIARAAVEFSIPLLARLFSERVSKLHQV